MKTGIHFGNDSKKFSRVYAGIHVFCCLACILLAVSTGIFSGKLSLRTVPGIFICCGISLLADAISRFRIGSRGRKENILSGLILFLLALAMAGISYLAIRCLW